MEMGNNTICRHSMTTINFYIVYIQTNTSPLIFMQSHLQYLLHFSNSSLLDSKYIDLWLANWIWTDLYYENHT